MIYIPISKEIYMPKKYLSILLIVLLITPQLLATPLPTISADGAILIEPKTNTVLYAKNMNETFYPASTTKVLTCLALLQHLPLDQIATKTQDAVNTVPSDSSHIGLSVGDQYTVYDGLHGILMGSDNFISHDLAILDQGSMTSFANVLNTMMLNMPIYNSHFVNAHGYHDPNHYTTPYDLAQITKHAFSHPILTQIAGTPTYDFKVRNSGKVIPLKHTSLLLDSKSVYYNPAVVASKTGYHTPAGRTLVAKAVYDDIELIGVIMRADHPSQFEDMNTLLSYGAENFSFVSPEIGPAYIQNATYSEWAKPYVTQALENMWILPSIHNYQTNITSHEFVNLLKSASSSSYHPILTDMIHSNSYSIYRENLPATKEELAVIIYNLLNPLNLYTPLSQPTISDLEKGTHEAAITFCVNTGLMSLDANGNFSPTNPVTYEAALCLTSKVNGILTRYDSYGLPNLPF